MKMYFKVVAETYQWRKETAEYEGMSFSNQWRRSVRGTNALLKEVWSMNSTLNVSDYMRIW